MRYQILFQNVDFRLREHHTGAHLSLPVDCKGSAARLTAHALEIRFGSIRRFGDAGYDGLSHLKIGFGIEGSFFKLHFSTCSVLWQKPGLFTKRSGSLAPGRIHVGVDVDRSVERAGECH